MQREPNGLFMWRVERWVIEGRPRFVGLCNSQRGGKRAAEEDYECRGGERPPGGYVWQDSDVQSELVISEFERYTVTDLEALENPEHAQDIRGPSPRQRI